MAIVPLFDATKWIYANLKGGADVAPDTMGAFSSFSRMWLLFESVLCQGNPNSKEFVRIASTISPPGIPVPTLAAVKDYASFWAERFPDAAPLCARLLNDAKIAGSSEENSVAAMALLLMLSAHEIKQGLFYEVKSVDSINEQLENLDVASQSLGALLSMAGPSIVAPTVSRTTSGRRRAPKQVSGK